MTQLEIKQADLIDLLGGQMNQLSIMSKIELGDDVIEAIKKLQVEIKQARIEQITISDNFQIGPDGAFELIEIDRDELFKLYMRRVDFITEECDWVTSFGPEEIVDMIADILENNPQLINNGEHTQKNN
jgi:hypothetical protein